MSTTSKKQQHIFTGSHYHLHKFLEHSHEGQYCPRLQLHQHHGNPLHKPQCSLSRHLPDVLHHLVQTVRSQGNVCYIGSYRIMSSMDYMENYRTTTRT